MPTELGSQHSIESVIVAGNRGHCGGVNMALEATRQVLQIVDGREPVYTLWSVVNNKPTMQRLDQMGLVNVQKDWDKIPDGGILIFPAHGKPPAYLDIAKEKGLLTIDATCQLVTRVHSLARKAHDEGKHVVYLGKEDHPETIGVLGELDPENVTFIKEDTLIEEIELQEGVESVVYSQTTLSTDRVRDQQKRLKLKFPSIIIPNRWDICPAVENRQGAADDMLDNFPIDFFLVAGSSHSDNTLALVSKAEKRGIPTKLVDEPEDIQSEWFDSSVKNVGATSGASTDEIDLQKVLDWFRVKGIDPVVYLPQFSEEKDVTFRLPQKDLDALRQRYD